MSRPAERSPTPGTFAGEVRRQFGPVALGWGLDDPAEDDTVLPSLEYRGDRLSYDWMLDPGDGAVSVSVRLIVAGGVLHGWLEEIVAGSGLGVRQDVRAHPPAAAVASHIAWLTRLHPMLTGPGAEEFLERAGARKATPDLA